ncbi:hypothetical protein [Enhygromyxa salina]|uniref:Uncharacterized protein n=1 Tax=Enhygromyxa salina TaxID=215803 RepID=A0A2S9XTZ4_9BACT|nr:hypothetical protein [Enhygromyxa salina]PRP96200.1 hypothetical protein ENSA7_70140 [Enhygromyxa salina]
MIPPALRRFVPQLLAALVLWSAPAYAQSPGSDSAGNPDIRALWSDGGELLLAGGRQAIYLYGRSGEQEATESVDVELFVDAAGTRAAGSVLAVFAAADGRIVSWRPGAVSQERAPLLAGDEIVAVVVDASGTIYAIGREHALYERSTRRWRVYPYPTKMRPLAAASSPGGRVHIVGRDGLLVRFLDGEWDRPLVPGLSPETIRAPWYDAWYSAVTESLWVRVGRDRLVQVEFGHQRAATQAEIEAQPLVREFESESESEAEDARDPEGETQDADLHVSGSVPTRELAIPIDAPAEGEPPPGFTAITGVSSAAGDRVVTTAGGRVWLWDRERFVLVGRDVGLVHDLVLDEGQDVAWVATLDALERVPLVAISAQQAEQPLGESDQKLLERLRRREAWQLRNADAPRFFWMPTVRVDNGVVFPLGATPVAGYSLEIGAGAMLQPLVKERGPTLWVWPEVGYRFETHPSRGGHLFDLGVGVGFGTHMVAGFYRPRLVLGGIDRPTDDGPAVYGLRHGVALEALWGVIGVEFSHQYLGSNEGGLNDVRLGLSINLAPLIWIGILWATIPTGD